MWRIRRRRWRQTWCGGRRRRRAVRPPVAGAAAVAHCRRPGGRYRRHGRAAPGAAFTVTAVVRLSLHARRAEIDIMQLVGAPIGFIRGPFITEGTLLGGIGAVLAIVALAVGHVATRSTLGEALAAVSGSEGVAFLSVGTCSCSSARASPSAPRPVSWRRVRPGEGRWSL
ncbi:MAG: FtsX-like permease family protein [Vicinamibacterales bacterium]